MATSLNGPTLAIALDGAEPSLVRRLMAAGVMPVLSGIAAGGQWSTVESSTSIGSASVWPTFVSASEPRDHGIHYVWRWEPKIMSIVREHGAGIVPWWRAVALDGRRVLTLDVPYLPFADVEGCVEVAEWGAHDRTSGRVKARPARLADEITRDPGLHPYHHDIAPPHDRPSAKYLVAATDRSCTGARMRGDLAARLIGQERPDLALIVFTETHRASHLLWQTVAPEDPLLIDAPRGGPVEALASVFSAADSAIGRIIESMPPGGRVIVFSLHGMRSARGVPTVLHRLLVHLGYAAERPAAQRSLGDQGRAAFGMAKDHAPQWLKLAWRRTASPDLLTRVAETTALKQYDWNRTRAFCLPTDQHGWVQINLEGREARGIVPASHYAGLCDEIAEALLDARSQDGRPIVERVLRMADQFGGRPPPRLPDLVVHWLDAAHDTPLRVAGSDIVSRPEGLRLTGKHAESGFLVTSDTRPLGDSVPSHALGNLIVG